MVQPDQQPDQELLGSQVPSVKSAAYKSNLDPMAVLKRVEELRRWQEEEKMKLLQAHEDQMNQFRMEQERLTKQVTGASQYPTPQQTTFQQSNLTKQNCRYLYDDAYSSESDSNLQLPNNKELQTSTDSGYTNSEGHFTTNNSSELTIPIPTMQNKKQTNPQYYHSSADDEDTSDSSLNEQDLKLVKLITNQIRMKKINLEAFIDDDFDNDDALNVEKALASYDDYSEPLKDAKSSSDKIERVDDEDLDDNQQLSTILEVSCESESPLKKTQKRAGTGSLRTKVDDIHEEDPEQEIENVIECNEKDEIKSKNSNVLDVDSIPIGVKPTNKMSFEELLEESLKKQDQLDMEQQKNGNRKKPVVKKPFLMKNSGTNKVQAQAKVQQSVAPVSAPVSVPAPVPVQVKISKDVPSEFPEFEFNAAPKHSGAPRPFLKRGEGLKRFQSKQNESAVSNKSESNKPSVKSNNGAQQLRSNSTTSLNNQLAQQQQMTQQRIMRKSQSITNVNQNTTSATKKTLPQKFNLQSKSSTTLNNENQNSLRSKSKILESSAISTLENSTAKANQKLKPAVQVNSTPAPEQVTENLRVKSVVSNSDDELKEFEKLEQYVDEHPSFRSSVSFVENVLSSNPDQNSKANNKNSSKATKFAYMLNLLNSNNSKKLADLLEEELNELSNTDMSDDRALSNSFSYDKPENLNENIESEALNEYKEHEFNSSRQRSSSSCSNSSIDSLTNRRRSHSASSGQSSSRVVMRKIKRIQIGDQVQQNSTEQKVKYASITASETALNLKKKYSCINYEDAADFYTSKENDKDEFCEDQFEAETSYDRQKMMLSSNSKLQLQLPKTSSRSNSQENLPTNEKKIKFDDRNSWDCNEDNASTTKRTDSAFKIDYNDESNRVSSDEEAAPVSQLMGKLFPSLKKQKQQKLIQQQHEQQLKDKEAFDRIKQQQQQHTTISNNTGISVSNTNLSQSDNINANILKQKLAQLETEIERFQKKNIELAKLKEKCEAEIKSAEIQRKQFDRQKEEELARLKEIHDEEMKKLRLEKKIFEQYKQSLKETPDRKEREELERMKRQVNELADEIKLKESRWMANNSRLKERIETLEEEKLELKKELQFLEKQRIESLMSTNNNVPTSIINHQATKFTGHQTTNTSKQSPQSLGNNHNHNMIESNLFIDNSIKQQQSYEQITSKNSTATATNAQQVQPPNPNLMVMKRSISEKSLHSSSSSSSSTSSSSSCSSSSSASIGSTGSNSSQVRSHLNSDYYHQRQDSVSKNTLVNHQIPMQHLQPSQNFVNCNSTDAITLNYGPTPVTSSSNIAQSHQPINRNSYSPSSGRQATKSVKFKLDYPAQSNQAVPIPHSTPIPTNYEHDKNFIENNTSQNTSNTSNSSCSTSYSTGEEYVTTQSYGNQRKIRVKETRHFEDKHIEKYLEDGTTLTIFPNGTVKEVSADKRCTYVKFFNGDRKEMNHDSGTETYFYAETNITQIIYSNGMTILKFPSGQIEKHHTNKTREIIFPDKICKFIYPDGSEESRLPNGTCIKIDQQGGKVIEYPNKQREIHTKDYKRREYPDGSIKTVYTNGISETRYANGRTRIKDAQGNIISDKKA